MKTTLTAKIERKTQQIDATGIPLGRLATNVATLLRGKHKADYTPHIDNGDFVEVANIAQAKITGKKLTQKEYKHYSGYPGGLKRQQMWVLFEKNPGDVLRRTVKQMLPPNSTREEMLKRLIIKK